MIGVIWDCHRRALTATAAVVVLVIGAVVVGVAATSRGVAPSKGAPPSPAPSRTPAPCTAPCAQAKSPGTSAPAPIAYEGPARVTPAATPAQHQVDAELSGAESPSLIAAGEALAVPAPATSMAYPAVTERSDPAAYAKAFVTELLTFDAATDRRSALLAWAQYEEAPNSLPGVPAAVADKSLVGSLDGLGGIATPIASTAGWPGPASGAAVRVTGVSAAVAPQWTQLTETGWQPTDPLMTIESVTGTLSESGNGATGPRPFVLDVTLGGARHHPGYGAVSVNDWTVAG